tara:strand:- start:492 stop:2198 length:1707 start_codon:yes stop_codon:yes gene_type:complete
MSCDICCENYNKSSRKSIKCQYCPFEACADCCKKYILDKEEPTCMNISCEKVWTRKYIAENLTQAWLNRDFTKMQEKICFDKEKAMLPQTVEIISRRKTIKEKENEIENYDEEIEKLNKTIRTIRRKQRDLHIEIRELEGVDDSKEKSNYNSRVCSSDNCRGFLNNKWVCGVCDKRTCNECNTIVDENHVCKQEDIDTFKMIVKETRQCPTCSTNIYKIDGCDQMWCTQCHTAFSWKTGRIEKVIHNPHYYEYHRQNTGNVPIQPGQAECGRGIIGVAGVALARSIDNSRNKVRTFMYDKQIASMISIIDGLDNQVLTVMLRTVLRGSTRYLNGLYPDDIKDEIRGRLVYDCASRIVFDQWRANVDHYNWIVSLPYIANDDDRKKAFDDILNEASSVRSLYKPIDDKISWFHIFTRRMAHLEVHEINRYRIIEDNTELRIDYLTNKIDEEQFKCEVQKADKRVQKGDDIRDVANLLTTAFIDIIYRFEHEVINMEIDSYEKVDEYNCKIYNTAKEIKNLKMYCDNLLEDHRKAFGGVGKIVTLTEYSTNVIVGKNNDHPSSFPEIFGV